jgi:cell division transport system ATP-binding protein
MDILRLEQLQIGYPLQPLGLPINLTLRAGEIAFADGPTGAGRTALVRTLIGEIPPLSGTAVVLGESITETSPARQAGMRRQIGLILADDFLLDEHTVYDNVSLPLTLAGVGAAQICRRVNTVLSEFVLLLKARTRLRELGAGQRRIVSVAIVAVKCPPLVIADLRADATDQTVVVQSLLRLATLGAAVLLCRPQATVAGRLELTQPASIHHELLVS